MTERFGQYTFRPSTIRQYVWSAAMFREQDTEARLPAILEGRVLESRTEPGDSRPHDAAPGGAKSASRRLGRGFNKRTLIAAAATMAIIAGGAFGTEWWVNGRYVISTDDAYVR